MPSMYELCLNHARADRAMRSLVADRLAKSRLSIMEWLALNIIAAGPKQGISMSQIAGSLDVTLPQVTALVSTLTKLRFVKQKILVKDRRGRQVIVTIRGRRTLLRLESNMSEAMDLWLQDIPKAKAETYLQVVADLAKPNN